jgi:hypothetical protein
MIREKQRFDDVGDVQPDGSVDFEYHGYNYRITIAEQEFRVRTYDDTPSEAIVISPVSAQQLPQARQLVEYLAAELGCKIVKFYYGPTGGFRAVSFDTLDFIS